MSITYQLAESVLNDIKENYSNNKFYTERDIVWTFQRKLMDKINKDRLPFKVINDYGLLKAPNRSKSVDLAIINNNAGAINRWQKAELVIEFKYEPNKNRAGDDIPACKFPVTSWGSILKDIDRIKEFKTNKLTEIAISILFDEGGRYINRTIPKESFWINGTNGLNLLLTVT